MNWYKKTSTDKIEKNNKDSSWRKLEKEVQQRSKNKDNSFRINGKWKKFVRTQNGYKVFKVDGDWIRNNLCSYFGHGGHGLVHEFIPINEIWIGSRHWSGEGDKSFDCGCEKIKEDQKMTEDYFNSTIIHEITECEEMKKGKEYWRSHQTSLKKEKEINILSDPYNDIPKKQNELV